MRRKSKQEVEDDGRSYADMNVDGMPWYRPRQQDAPDEQEKIELNSEQGRYALRGALLAALLVAGIFALGFFLFIVFCDVVWFQ